MFHESRSVIARNGDARVVPVFALITLVATVAVGGWTPAGWVPLDVAVGLAVPFGALFGIYGAIAVGVGWLVRAAIVGGPTPLTAVQAGGCILVGTVAAAACRSASTAGLLPGPAWFTRYAAATAVAAAAGSAALGLGMKLIGHAPFFLAAGRTVSFGVTAILLGTPVVWVARSLGTSFPGTSGISDQGGLGTLALVSYGWLVLGTVGSVGYWSIDVLYAYDPNALQTMGLGMFRVIHDDAVFGHGAVRAQVALGGLMGTLLGLSLWRILRGIETEEGEICD